MAGIEVQDWPALMDSVTPESLGEWAFGSQAWIEAGREALQQLVVEAGPVLASAPRIVLCEVGHNPPAHLHPEGPFAWWAEIEGGQVRVGAGVRAEADCTFRVEADHSVLSNLARLLYRDSDPVRLAEARDRLRRLTRWKVSGALPDHPGLSAVLRQFHDAMAPLTLPRLTFMTPEWVGLARTLLTRRAASPKYAPGIASLTYTFSEEFIRTPRYAFPDGAAGGFWVRVEAGRMTVGAGALPPDLGPADTLTFGDYAPVIPVGRTVNSLMTEAEAAQSQAYAERAFRFDKALGRRPVDRTFPSGRGPMPPELGRIFLPLHDELSKRTAGDLPADYDPAFRTDGTVAEPFDRAPGYDPSWLRYAEVDIYGQSLERAP